MTQLLERHPATATISGAAFAIAIVSAIQWARGTPPVQQDVLELVLVGGIVGAILWFQAKRRRAKGK